MSEYETNDVDQPEIDPGFQRRDEHGRRVLPYIEQDGKTVRLYCDPLYASPEESQLALEQSLNLWFDQLEREWNELRVLRSIDRSSPASEAPPPVSAPPPPSFILLSLEDPRTLDGFHVPDGYVVEVLGVAPLGTQGEVVYRYRFVKREDNNA
jgi:hypothetical protein